jgi:hypothetical protein
MRRRPWLLIFALLAACEPENDPLARLGLLGEPPPAAPSAEPLMPEIASPPGPSSQPGPSAAPEPSASPPAVAPPAPGRPHLYATWKRIPLTRGGNHFEGELRLLEDSLVTRRGASRDGRAWLTENDPALPARLELLNARGEVIQTEPFDRPIADIHEVHLHGDGRPTYQMTVDYSCGMGSYCGPITSFFEVEGPGMHHVQAVDDASNQFRDLTLMESLKTSWRRVPARSGQGVDFIEMKCRPSLSFPQIFASAMRQEEREIVFLTVYERYSFEKAAWVKRWVQKKEYRDFIDGDIRDFIIEGGRVRFL